MRILLRKPFLSFARTMIVAAAGVLALLFATPSSSAACVPVPTGAVAWWPLDGNASNAIANDSGVIVGNPVFTNGLVGQAMFFDGVGDGVESQPTNSLNVGTNDGFTV